MSRAGHGAPTKRPEPDTEISENSEVVVERDGEDKGDQKGVVREVRDYEVQTRLVVQTREGEINVRLGQADRLTGADADIAKDLIGGQRNV
ncbi:hypothetical protein [Haloarcula amylovorans]|uniref:hypothetical protein n=1 Tax=Haloarcula amylovorans TaxID=2562280 RepID=UPI00107658A9|nr:hypothetical protein [Halomicroarcula amylolytica]